MNGNTPEEDNSVVSKQITNKSTTLPVQEQIPSISAEARKEVVSNYSIKSVVVKQEVLRNFKEEEIDEASLPREKFTEKEFFDSFNAYVETLKAQGERIQASTLEMGEPTLHGTVLDLQVPNKTIRDEVHREEAKLLGFLRKSLSNYDISLNIIENEEIIHKIRVTPDEKFARLVELNPLLQDFKRTLDLKLVF
ncbi:DNA polymerase III subunit gamma/tau [Capnocytophaga sp. H2931]|uniref:DNA polymerase III subunit gamma/tau n=1 Tax=Capnocytophaga sp. H2931 TaxID=1945657 RepID=UPI001E46B7E8|nr:DNA polymerase III subunit gamma/tau [Capnocytophaga sp. H2931]